MSIQKHEQAYLYKPTLKKELNEPFALNIDWSGASSRNSSLLFGEIDMLFHSYRVHSPSLQNSSFNHVSETDLYILSNYLFSVIRAYTTINSYLMQRNKTASIHLTLARFGNFNINMLIADNLLMNDRSLSEEDFIHSRAMFANKAIQGLQLLYNLLMGLQIHKGIKFCNEVSYIRKFMDDTNRLLKNTQFLKYDID